MENGPRIFGDTRLGQSNCQHVTFAIKVAIKLPMERIWSH